MDRRHPPASLPLWALVLAVIGLGLPPLLPAALVLGGLSLSRAGRPEYAARRRLAVGALAVTAVAVPLWGVVLAVGVPSFTASRSRARQAECAAQLRAALAAEEAWRGGHPAYSVHPAEVGFAPPADARYLLRFAGIGPLATAGSPAGEEAVGFVPSAARAGGAVDALDEGLPEEVRTQLGVRGACPDCSLTLACAANLDDDPTLDVWSLSTAARPRPGGAPVPAGEPFHHRDDLTEAEASLPAWGLPQAAPAPAPPPPVEDDDDRSWQTYAFDGRTGLRETAAGERCLLTCTGEDGARLWEAMAPCQARKGERRFLAPDGERLVVLVAAPVRGKAWRATEVMRVYQRGELAYRVMGAAVLPERAMRSSISWLQGCFGAPGEPPRYAGDGLAVEYTTIAGVEGRVPLEADRPPETPPREPKRRK
jgi:hypothetical protein